MKGSFAVKRCDLLLGMHPGHGEILALVGAEQQWMRDHPEEQPGIKR